MSALRDGETDGHVRWCAGCGQGHGVGYECSNYPPVVLDEIREANARMRRNLQDPKWAQRQLEKGVPPEAIAIFRLFAGL